jgi:hypothetical protein
MTGSSSELFNNDNAIYGGSYLVFKNYKIYR